MNKAKEIHKNKLRELRAPILKELDIQLMRAIEIGDLELQSVIATKKQMLRDVTIDPSIDDASSPEELKLAIPEILLST